jgi:hypothetical protein
LKPFTRAQLRDVMLRSFRRGNIQIESASFSPEKQSADAEYEWANGRLHMKLRIDAAQDGGIEAVVHELLHAHADDANCPFARGILPCEWHPDLRENALQGIEGGIVKHLKKHPRLFEAWRAAIARKMGAV